MPLPYVAKVGKATGRGTPAAEADWNRAKAIVAKEYGDVPDERRYALVTKVFKNITKGHTDECMRTVGVVHAAGEMTPAQESQTRLLESEAAPADKHRAMLATLHAHGVHPASHEVRDLNLGRKGRAPIHVSHFQFLHKTHARKAADHLKAAGHTVGGAHKVEHDAGHLVVHHGLSSRHASEAVSAYVAGLGLEELVSSGAVGGFRDAAVSLQRPVARPLPPVRSRVKKPG